MLFDEEETRIMSAARQPDLRDPGRPDVIFRRVFDDFFAGRRLAGTRMLELGPGQYDFTRMVEAAGVTVVSMDHDPAVVALGQKRGHSVIFADFRTFDWGSLKAQFDGIFCRNSITPIWFDDPRSYGDFIDAICSVLGAGGWGWMTPIHGALSKAAPERIRLMLAAERQAFERNGFGGFAHPQLHRTFALPEPAVLYLKNLQLPHYLRDAVRSA